MLFWSPYLKRDRARKNTDKINQNDHGTRMPLSENEMALSPRPPI